MKQTGVSFVRMCVAAGLSAPTPEFRFHPIRRWRFDFCWPDLLIAVEQDGGLFIRGRHSGGAGQVRDMAKMNAAGKLGWRVFRFTPAEMASGEAVTFLAPIVHAAMRAQ